MSVDPLQKTKDIVTGTREAGIAISRRIVIAIGTGVSLYFQPPFWASVSAFILGLYFDVFSLCLVLQPLSHYMYFSFVFIFQVWVCFGHHTFIFYLINFIGTSRMMVCVQTIFLHNKDLYIITYMNLEFAYGLASVFLK